MRQAGAAGYRTMIGDDIHTTTADIEALPGIIARRGARLRAERAVVASR
jgi:hypothetical protein